jgi:transglutaminase-like putative cysteine protease
MRSSQIGGRGGLAFGPSPDEARRIAERVGCTVKRRHGLHDGTISLSLDCKTWQNKLAFLAELAEYDARTPEVRRVAERVAQSVGGDRFATIVALHALVRDRVTHTPEIVETFTPTMRTLELGLGDCDDVSRALVALLRSLGYSAGMGTVGNPPAHVAPKVKFQGRWWWLEPSIDALPGEHPLAAAKRLGIKVRPELSGA